MGSRWPPRNRSGPKIVVVVDWSTLEFRLSARTRFSKNCRILSPHSSLSSARARRRQSAHHRSRAHHRWTASAMQQDRRRRCDGGAARRHPAAKMCAEPALALRKERAHVDDHAPVCRSGGSRCRVTLAMSEHRSGPGFLGADVQKRPTTRLLRVQREFRCKAQVRGHSRRRSGCCVPHVARGSPPPRWRPRPA
jgi:hypothetical protein